MILKYEILNAVYIHHKNNKIYNLHLQQQVVVVSM